MNGGIYRHDEPPLQQRRFVPVLPLEEPALPPRTNAVVMAIVLASWSVSDGSFSLHQSQIALGKSGDDPPPASRVTQDVIRTAWEPPFVAPPRLPTVVQEEAAPAADDPPLVSRVIFNTILDRWQPEPVTPVKYATVVQEFVPPDADDPPPKATGWLAVAIREAWDRPEPLTLYQSVVGLGKAGDEPPRFSRATLHTILESWQPTPVTPVKYAKTVQGVAPPVVDDPPPRRTGGLHVAVAEVWNWSETTVIYRAVVAPVDSDPQPVSRANFYTILESWRPPAPAPRQLPRTVGPLTLTYGDQPPRVGNRLQTVLAAWQPADPVRQRPVFVPLPPPAAPADVPFVSQAKLSQFVDAWQATTPEPKQLRRDIAPLTLTYGQTPPVRGPLRAADAAVIATVTWEPPPPEPRQLPRTVAPLTLTYGDQPPRKTPAGLYAAVWTWQVPEPLRLRAPLLVPIPPPTVTNDPIPSSRAGLLALVDSWRPPAPEPKQLRRDIAPLTLTYGQAPPVRGPLRAADAAVISAIAWEPPPPEPRQLPLRVAPLTLTYGQAPPVRGPLRAAELAEISAINWEPPPPPPWQLPRTAAVLLAVLTDTVPVRGPARRAEAVCLVVAWEPPPPPPRQLPLQVAPLTLTYGQAPPIRGPLRAADAAMISGVVWAAPPPLPRRLLPLTNPPASGGPWPWTLGEDLAGGFLTMGM